MNMNDDGGHWCFYLTSVTGKIRSVLVKLVFFFVPAADFLS